MAVAVVSTFSVIFRPETKFPSNCAARNNRCCLLFFPAKTSQHLMFMEVFWGDFVLRSVAEWDVSNFSAKGLWSEDGAARRKVAANGKNARRKNGSAEEGISVVCDLRAMHSAQTKVLHRRKGKFSTKISVHFYARKRAEFGPDTFHRPRDASFCRGKICLAFWPNWFLLPSFSFNTLTPINAHTHTRIHTYGARMYTQLIAIIIFQFLPPPFPPNPPVNTPAVHPHRKWPQRMCNECAVCLQKIPLPLSSRTSLHSISPFPPPAVNCWTLCVADFEFSNFQPQNETTARNFPLHGADSLFFLLRIPLQKSEMVFLLLFFPLHEYACHVCYFTKIGSTDYCISCRHLTVFFSLKVDCVFYFFSSVCNFIKPVCFLRFFSLSFFVFVASTVYGSSTTPDLYKYLFLQASTRTCFVVKKFIQIILKKSHLNLICRICLNKRPGRLICRSNKNNSKTHQNPSVLCTPPCEKSLFLVGAYFGVGVYCGR